MPWERRENRKQGRRGGKVEGRSRGRRKGKRGEGKEGGEVRDIGDRLQKTTNFVVAWQRSIKNKWGKKGKVEREREIMREG